MDSVRDTLTGGLPHSEIPGSTIARISPGLFAACHVLHRLSVPRHPPDALFFALEHHTKRQSQGAERRNRDLPGPSAIAPAAIARCGNSLHLKTHFGQEPTRAPSPPRPAQSLPPRAKPEPKMSRTRRTLVRLGHNSLLHISINKTRRQGPKAAAANRISSCRASAHNRQKAHRQKASIQPGGGERDRTDDLLLAKQALSQLSYTPVRKTDSRTTEQQNLPLFRFPPFCDLNLVGQGGFEPPTSRLSSARSNQLSY